MSAEYETPCCSGAAAQSDAGVVRFATGTPSHALLAHLNNQYGLVHDSRCSRLLSPYHYFWTSSAAVPIHWPVIQARHSAEIIDAHYDNACGVFASAGFRQGRGRSTTPSAAHRLPTPGRDAAIIAVIDSGFDLDHPNLNYVGRALHFDAAGFFGQQRRRLGLGIDGPTRRPIYDAGRSIRAHGTSVAGAAAAIKRRADEPAIDGVAPGFPVMPLKVSARPTSAEVAAAINWAVAHGARVINMSFKTLGQPVINAAIEQAARSGVVLCAASGNQRQDFPHLGVDFPARHPDVIAVGAIDRRGRRKHLNQRVNGDWGSQYGDELDVVAPGLEVQTLDDSGALGVLPGNYLMLSMGTSIAAPQVAGLAALLFGMQPDLSGAQVRAIIEANCHKLEGYQFRRIAGRAWSWNREVGYGSVQLAASIEVAAESRGSRRGDAR